MTKKIGRNDPCYCGSGKKYKKCCLVKDREEKKELPEKMDSMNRMSVSAGLAGRGDDIFDSKEMILESIRAEGFEPVATEETYDIDDEPVTTLTIELYCHHGHSEIERVYFLQDDGKWEFIEEGWGTHCPECENKK